MRAERFVLGAVNRARGEEILPGGKGINVSYVLRELGIPSVALGFAAGFTGDELERMVRARGIQTEFIRVLGSTRINVKVRAEQETDINGCGPLAQDKDIIALAHKLHAAEANSVCVLSGSAPASLSSDCYVRLFNQADRPDMRIALDASGALLRRSLTLGPWLIKPNREELEELCGRALAGKEAVACAARELRGLGARNVLVSLGEAEPVCSRRTARNISYRHRKAARSTRWAREIPFWRVFLRQRSAVPPILPRSNRVSLRAVLRRSASGWQRARRSAVC